MSEKIIGEMADTEFRQMIERFIDRPAGLDDAVPAELVFAMLDQSGRSQNALIVLSRLAL